MIVATAVMCTGRQGYLGYYAYWTRKNLRKTIDSTVSPVMRRYLGKRYVLAPLAGYWFL